MFYLLFFARYYNGNNTPVILWIQGGPGWSGLFGYYFNNGPYKTNMKL